MTNIFQRVGPTTNQFLQSVGITVILAVFFSCPDWSKHLLSILQSHFLRSYVWIHSLWSFDWFTGISRNNKTNPYGNSHPASQPFYPRSLPAFKSHFDAPEGGICFSSWRHGIRESCLQARWQSMAWDQGTFHDWGDPGVSRHAYPQFKRCLVGGLVWALAENAEE